MFNGQRFLGAVLLLFMSGWSLSVAAAPKCARALMPTTRETADRREPLLSELAFKNGIRYVMLRFTQEELGERVANLGWYSGQVSHAELVPLYKPDGTRAARDWIARGYDYADGGFHVQQKNWMVGLIFDLSILDRPDVTVSSQLNIDQRRQRADLAATIHDINRGVRLTDARSTLADVPRSTTSLDDILSRASRRTGSPAGNVYFDLTDWLSLSQAVAVWVPDGIDTYSVKARLSRMGVGAQTPVVHDQDQIPDLSQISPVKWQARGELYDLLFWAEQR